MTDTDLRPPTMGPQKLDVLPRAEFLDFFAQEYASGQHVTFLGPTQRGKTTLSHQMLGAVISPELPCVLIALKPPGRDHVMMSAADRLNLKVVSEWPPTKMQRRYDKYQQRNGYVMRPHHSMTADDVDHKETNSNLREQTRRTLNSCYASASPVIVVVDETHIVQNNLKLKDELESPLMRGAPICAEWNLIQRGYYITYLAYSAPEWVLIYFDPDQTNQRRYGEIGGVDPKYVASAVSQLRTKRGDDGKSTVSEALCIKRSGPEMFIVSTD